MDVNLVKSTTPQQTNVVGGTGPTGRGDDVYVARNSQVDNEKVKIPATEKSEKAPSEEQRQKSIEEAAQAIVNDIYAVSDTKFTIFKDASGQYITRITSLRDGKVTYIPEPEVLQYMAHRSHIGHGSVVLKA